MKPDHRRSPDMTKPKRTGGRVKSVLIDLLH
jgi:hypothetical protein